MPAVTLLTPSLLVMLKSALVVIVSVSEAVLLALTGSLTALETEAVFVWLAVVEDGTVKVTVTVALEPLVIVPRAQVKLGLLLQVPWDGVTVPRVNPAGHVSVMLAPVASDGPPLWTVIV